MNESKKQLWIRFLLRQWVSDIICLQETKLEFVSREVVWSLWWCQHVGYWSFLPSKWAFGGILIMFDKKVVEILEECIGEFIVTCSFRNMQDGFQWAFAWVYGHNIDLVRRLLWEELAIIPWWELPCLSGCNSKKTTQIML